MNKLSHDLPDPALKDVNKNGGKIIPHKPALINVFWPAGSGGNFLGCLIKEALDISNGGRYDRGSHNNNSNEYNGHYVPPIMQGGHPGPLPRNNINYWPPLEEYLGTKNIFVIVNDDVKGTAVLLMAIKHMLDPDIEDASMPPGHEPGSTIKEGPLDDASVDWNDQFDIVTKWSTWLHERNPYSVFLLDYRKFFIEQNEKHIEDFWCYLCCFPSEPINMSVVIKTLKEYNKENIQVLEAHGYKNHNLGE